MNIYFRPANISLCKETWMSRVLVLSTNVQLVEFCADVKQSVLFCFCLFHSKVVVIASQAYLESPWCAHELSVIKTKIDSLSEGTVHVIFTPGMERQKLPTQLQGCRYLSSDDSDFVAKLCAEVKTGKCSKRKKKQKKLKVQYTNRRVVKDFFLPKELLGTGTACLSLLCRRNRWIPLKWSWTIVGIGEADHARADHLYSLNIISIWI